ncbi:hypothetical protein F4779DRAFT_618798 [Xylariaceae sp. FL0662B]|nr:hypothetical protein F4779DRAFT_618798 [Xylariaceae sp. FL0662B]
MATTSFPAFPSTWTAPSSCLASTAYYYVVVSTFSGNPGGIIFSNMFGIPTPTNIRADPSGACVPPSFKSDVPYITDGPCPNGYSTACATGGTYRGTPASSVTCCPSGAFDFSCYDNQYGCIAGYTNTTWTGSRTDFALTPPTGRPETRVPEEGENVWAWGIKMISITPTSASGTQSVPSTAAPAATNNTYTQSAEPVLSSSTSNSQAVGIGVGVSIGKAKASDKS